MHRHYASLALSIPLLIAACGQRPPATDFPRTPTYAISPHTPSSLRSALLSDEKLHPGLSAFHLLTTGTEGLLTRLALVESAEHTIDLQYFITEEDSTGELLMEALLRAADRGVRVRVLLDYWNLDDNKQCIAALDKHPNIEIRIFNPVGTKDQTMLGRFSSLLIHVEQFTRRMHNKAIIADNQAAVVGGRNVGDEYFDASSDVNFKDLDVLAAGPIAAPVSQAFDRYWNSMESYPIGALALPPAPPEIVAHTHRMLHAHWDEAMQSTHGRLLSRTPLPEQLRTHQLALIWAPADIAADNPYKIDAPPNQSNSRPAMRLDQLTEHAQKEFIAVSPYLVPLDEGVQWLSGLVKRGVRVRMLTNSLSSTDVVPVHAAYSHYREQLVENGVELYELKPIIPPHRHAMLGGSSRAALHTKIYVIDEKDVVVGSFNLDPRSILNTEMVLIIHSPELARQVADMFAQITQPSSSFHVMLAVSGGDQHLVWVTEEDGKRVYYNSDPQAGFWRNVFDSIVSIVPIDDQL